MYVRSLEFEPVIEDIDVAIRALNGATRGSFSLRPADPTAAFMDICGDGQQFTIVVNRGGEELMLTDPRRGEHEVEVDFPGGQAVERPASQVVDRKTALQAARILARTGELDPSVQWKT